MSIERGKELFGFAVISNLGELEGDRIGAVLWGEATQYTTSYGTTATPTRVRASSSCAREMTSKTKGTTSAVPRAWRGIQVQLTLVGGFTSRRSIRDANHQERLL